MIFNGLTSINDRSNDCHVTFAGDDRPILSRVSRPLFIVDESRRTFAFSLSSTIARRHFVSRPLFYNKHRDYDRL